MGNKTFGKKAIFWDTGNTLNSIKLEKNVGVSPTNNFLIKFPERIFHVPDMVT
jgi:hypothetical protein